VCYRSAERAVIDNKEIIQNNINMRFIMFSKRHTTLCAVSLYHWLLFFSSSLTSVILTISGLVNTLIGGPQVPRPLET
jgi:hypothetical protein